MWSGHSDGTLSLMKPQRTWRYEDHRRGLEGRDSHTVRQEIGILGSQEAHIDKRCGLHPREVQVWVSGSVGALDRILQPQSLEYWREQRGVSDG